MAGRLFTCETHLGAQVNVEEGTVLLAGVRARADNGSAERDAHCTEDGQPPPSDAQLVGGTEGKEDHSAGLKEDH